jgi:hypothetical protein
MRKLHVLILALCAVACATCLSAQYTRSQTTAAYSERAGSGMNLLKPQGPESYDDTYFYVPLPFTFSYFDRSYNACYASSNGRVTFSAISATNFSTMNLTAPVSDPAARDAIMVIGGDLYAYPQDAGQTIKAFSESGRVVIQWDNAAFFSGTRLLFLNFQCHLLSNGNIEFHYGPEVNPASMPETPTYSSGIVNTDGTVSFPGFGNMTGSQTTRPSPDTLVTFAYSGSLTNTVVIEHGVYLPRTTYLAPIANAPVLSFRLRAVGTGDTIDDLSFANSDFAGAGDNVTLTLVEDTAPLGEYNGEAPLATSSMVSFFTTFATLNLVVTSGQTRNMLLLAGFATLDLTYYEVAFSLADQVIPAPIKGGMMQHQIILSEEAPGFLSFDNSTELPAPAVANETDVELASFTWQMLAGQPDRTFSDLTLFVTYTGTLSGADIQNIRLYRDGGTPGALDGDDTLLDTVPSITTSLNFSGLTEEIGQNGGCYLIVADIAASMGGVGQLQIVHQSDDSLLQSSSRRRTITDAASALYTGPSPEASLFSWIDLPGSTGVQAFSFHLRAAAGSGTVSAIQFNENSGSNLSSVMTAGLFGDNGSIPGRLDPTDAQIAGIFTIGATSMTFTPTVPLAANAAGADFHVGVDFTGAASVPFRLVLGPITHSFTDLAQALVTGPVIRPTGNAANGVDVTYTMNAADITVTNQDRVVLGTADVVVRGTGGEMPFFWFNVRNGPCGRGSSSNILVEAWREGTGPEGELDATDTLCYTIGGITGWGPGQAISTPSSMAMLFTARGGLNSDNLTVRGRFTLQFAGISGNEVRILPAPTTVPVLEFDINRQLSKSGKKGGGGGDGGCTTSGDSGNWMGLLAAMMAMVIAVRLRRTRA